MFVEDGTQTDESCLFKKYLIGSVWLYVSDWEID